MTPQDRPEAVMVFAAGLGTRMAPLTADRPKPLIPVAGRALLDRALDLAEDAGPEEGPALAVVNVHHRAPQILAHLAARPSRLPIRVADETARLLETGGGLRAALPLLGPGPVWTLNADAAWAGPNPLLALARAWGPDAEALLLLVPRARALGHKGGDFDIAPDGRLARGGAFVYTGAQILRTEGLMAIPDQAFSLNRLWDRMAERGTLRGLAWPGRWCDVGRPESIAIAEAMLAEGEPAGG